MSVMLLHLLFCDSPHGNSCANITLLHAEFRNSHRVLRAELFCINILFSSKKSEQEAFCFLLNTAITDVCLYYVGLPFLYKMYYGMGPSVVYLTMTLSWADASVKKLLISKGRGPMLLKGGKPNFMLTAPVISLL